MDSSKKKNIVRYLSFVIAFTMTIAVSVMCKGNDVVVSEVRKTSAEINKKCPITIDAYTRLDNTKVTENPLTLAYIYTVSVNKDSLTINLDEAKKNIMKTTQNLADTDPQMAYIRDNSVLLRYHYKDKNGKYLFDFTITPKKNTK